MVPVDNLLTEKNTCEPFDVGRMDYVFHFASPASPVDYNNHGIATLSLPAIEGSGTICTHQRVNL